MEDKSNDETTTQKMEDKSSDETTTKPQDPVLMMFTMMQNMLTVNQEMMKTMTAQRLQDKKDADERDERLLAGLQAQRENDKFEENEKHAALLATLSMIAGGVNAPKRLPAVSDVPQIADDLSQHSAFSGQNFTNIFEAGGGNRTFAPFANNDRKGSDIGLMFAGYGEIPLSPIAPPGGKPPSDEANAPSAAASTGGPAPYTVTLQPFTETLKDVEDLKALIRFCTLFNDYMRHFKLQDVMKVQKYMDVKLKNELLDEFADLINPASFEYLANDQVFELLRRLVQPTTKGEFTQLLVKNVKLTPPPQNLTGSWDFKHLCGPVLQYARDFMLVFAYIAEFNSIQVPSQTGKEGLIATFYKPLPELLSTEIKGRFGADEKFPTMLDYVTQFVKHLRDMYKIMAKAAPIEKSMAPFMRTATPAAAPGSSRPSGLHNIEDNDSSLALISSKPDRFKAIADKEKKPNGCFAEVFGDGPCERSYCQYSHDATTIKATQLYYHKKLTALLSKTLPAQLSNLDICPGCEYNNDHNITEHGDLFVLNNVNPYELRPLHNDIMTMSDGTVNEKQFKEHVRKNIALRVEQGKAINQQYEAYAKRGHL